MEVKAILLTGINRTRTLLQENQRPVGLYALPGD